jgi:hypothetical protein
MVRSILSLSTLWVFVGCAIPSTLGLPCETNAHCDQTQLCVEGTCMRSPPPEETMGTMTGLPSATTSTGTGEASESSGTDPSATSSGPSSSGSTTEPDPTSSSTGPSCGVDTCTDLDILLLVDTSDSMFQWLVPLANSLPALFDLFDDELSSVCSFHVGLANADRLPESNPAPCQYAGALLQRPSNCSAIEGAPAYYSTEVDGDASTAFAALQCTILTEGFSGSDDEYMLESMLGALNPENNAEGACNDGFRRPGANLVILYVSDEDDPTPSEEQDTVAETFQSYLDPDLVAFISVVADPSNHAAECVWDPSAGDEGTGAETPSALNGFLALSGIPLPQQARVDICQSRAYEFADAFDVFQSVCEG